MPDITTPKVLQGFNLFVDGRGYAAKVSECELPKLAIKTEEYQPGGYDVPIEVDLGMEKLESNMTLLDFDVEILSLFGLGHNKPVACTIRGSLGHGDGTTTPCVVQYQGMWKEIEPPKMKRAEKMEMKVTVALKYYKLEIGDKVIHEIDVENMKRIINGFDYLASARADIGI